MKRLFALIVPILLFYCFFQTTEAFTSVTNNQKLSLATSTPVGTVVQITDQGNALEQLVAASSSITAVLVSGAGSGELNGVYTQRGIYNGKTYYNLLDTEDDPLYHSLVWRDDGDGFKWYIEREPGILYYLSGDNVTYPWLATSWSSQNGAEDPAPTVASVTQGELDAGITVSGAGTNAINGVYLRNGSYQSLPTYLLQGQSGSVFESISIFRDSDYWEFRNVFDDDYYSPEYVFPWLITDLIVNDGIGSSPAPHVYRNDVASEANWVAYTPPAPTVTPSAGGGASYVPMYAVGSIMPTSTTTTTTTATSTSETSTSTPVTATTTPLLVIPPVIAGCQSGFLFSIVTGQSCIVTLTSITISSTTPPTHYIFNTNLSFHAQGSEVLKLQEYLQSEGLFTTTPNSIFGPITLSLVIKFQKLHSIIPASGYFGPITRNYVNTH